MSSVYELEPPTEGKVLLTTTHGEIEIELWAKECPKACRNFVGLCLEGYYDGVIWHRIIKDFMIQTGDPTGTGRGGVSFYGEAFKDEFHSRIKFNHRGQVAMANSGGKDTNQSQFFITLERCDWIDRKHTIFGKVVGHTIYNALQIAEMETEGDRPVEPHPKILKTEVLWNPFDDIVPRHADEPLADDVADADAAPRKKKKQKKKLNLLSFGEEAGEEDAELATMARPKVMSAHDAASDAPATEGDGRLAKPGSAEEAAALDRDEDELARRKAFREKMRRKLAAREDAAARGVAHESDGDGDDAPGLDAAGAFEAKMRASVAAKRDAAGADAVAAATEAATRDAEKAEKAEAKAARRARREAEKRAKEATKLRKLGIGKATLDASDAGLMTEREARREEAKRKRGRVAGRERDVLAKLAEFRRGLEGTLRERGREGATRRDEGGGGGGGGGAASDAKEEPAAAGESGGREGAAGTSRFVPEGLYYAEEEDEADAGGDWKAHSLAFVEERRAPGAYEASVDDYVVEDPLLEKGKGKYAKKR